MCETPVTPPQTIINLQASDKEARRREGERNMATSRGFNGRPDVSGRSADQQTKKKHSTRILVWVCDSF